VSLLASTLASVAMLLAFFRWVAPWWKRQCAQWGLRGARRILDGAGIDYDVWCDSCNLPVPKNESTQGPQAAARPEAQPGPGSSPVNSSVAAIAGLAAGELAECVIDHPEHHGIRYHARDGEQTQ